MDPARKTTLLSSGEAAIASPTVVLRFLNVFLAALSAGTLWAMLVSLVPLTGSLPAAAGLATRRAFEKGIDRYNPACTVLSALTALAILLLDSGLTATNRAAMTSGVTASLAVGITSVAWARPVDHRMGRDEDPPAPDYVALRSRWAAAHAVRTVAALIALGCYIVAAVA
jgi:hypothetical protein